MLIKFFRNGQGGGAGPVNYLIDREVVAYDENRNAIRDASGAVQMLARDPLPEVLHGNPDLTRGLIDACPHQWSYRAGVMAFTAEDAPSDDQQRSVIEAFERLAFAGLEPDQRDILWVRHTHEQRVELHFVTPRMELESGRSLNIAPPGYRKHYDALRDVLNKEFGWSDPLAPERAREAVSLIESVRRGEARTLIHDWITDRVEAGSIHDRPSMMSALEGAGFDLPRQGKNYITVRDPETDERWRLKGDIFHEDWTRQKTLERALERGAGATPSRSGSRLDGLTLEELQDRLRGSVERLARYNRERFGRSGGRQRAADVPDPARDRTGAFPPSGDETSGTDDRKYDQRGGDRGERGHGGNRSGDHLDQGAERDPLAGGLSKEPSRDANTAVMERDQSDGLPDWLRRESLPAGRGGRIDDGPRQTFFGASDADGARASALRRTIDERLGAIGQSVRSLGTALDRFDRGAAKAAGRLHDVADRLSGQLHDRLSRLREAFGWQRTDPARDGRGLSPAGNGGRGHDGDALKIDRPGRSAPSAGRGPSRG
jgi:hypothetical protein